MAGLVPAIHVFCLRGSSKTWVPGASLGMTGFFFQAPRLPRRGLAERGLRRGEPRDRHAVGRAGDVIQPDLMAERHRGRIAAVFAADADLEVCPRLAAALDADLDQFADAVAIDRDERI